MVAISFLLLQENIFGLPIFLIGQILLSIAGALTLWSGWDYLRAAWPSLQK